MKNLLFYLLIIALSATAFSCNNSEDNLEETLGHNSPLKSLKIIADDNDSYMVLDIYKAEFADLTVDNFSVRAKQISTDELEYLEDLNNELGESIEEHEHLPGHEHSHDFSNNRDETEILISNVYLSGTSNALELSFHKTGLLRGDGPTNYDYNGVVGSYCPKQCVRGFTGNPLNCSHTHWKVKKKQNSGTLFWSEIYSATSYSSSTTIGYSSNATYHKWRFKINPDKSCDATATYTVVWESCCP